MSILSKRLPIGKDLGYSTLSAGIDSSQTDITVTASGPFPTLGAATNRRRFIPAIICPAADPATMTFADLQSGEHVVITDHAAASTTLTVIRGDSPASHASGSLVMIMPTAKAWEATFNYLANLEAIMAAVLGAPAAGDPIIMNYGTDHSSFAATQSGTPAMTVEVASGIGAYRDQVFRGSAATMTGFTTPAGSTRVDLICFDIVNNVLVRVAGTEGAGAPAVPSDHAGLWEVAIDVAQSTILNADLTSIREFA